MTFPDVLECVVAEEGWFAATARVQYQRGPSDEASIGSAAFGLGCLDDLGETGDLARRLGTDPRDMFDDRTPVAAPHTAAAAAVGQTIYWRRSCHNWDSPMTLVPYTSAAASFVPHLPNL
jgi:hypothetical protein